MPGTATDPDARAASPTGIPAACRAAAVPVTGSTAASGTGER